MSLENELLYNLWDETLHKVYKAKKVPLVSVSPDVKDNLLSSFAVVKEKIPEDLIPAYFCFIISLCKHLKIYPTYKQLASEKNINNFLKSKNIPTVIKRKLVSSKNSGELEKFISEVKSTMRALSCGYEEAFIIVKGKYLWSNLENINYFISRVNAKDSKFLSLLSD